MENKLEFIFPFPYMARLTRVNESAKECPAHENVFGGESSENCEIREFPVFLRWIFMHQVCMKNSF